MCSIFDPKERPENVINCIELDPAIQGVPSGIKGTPKYMLAFFITTTKKNTFTPLFKSLQNVINV